MNFPQTLSPKTILFPLLIIAIKTTNADHQGDGTICVIGGGISGIIIASSLQEKGYNNVHLYEKEERLGGKMDTYRSKGVSGDSIVIEKGPIMYSQLMHYTMKYMNKVNLTSAPFDINDHSLFNPKTGVNFGKLTFSPELTSKFKKLTDLYKKYWHELSPALELGYDSPSSDAKLKELATPLGTWLRERKLSDLMPTFGLVLAAQGYGDMNVIPVAYALKFVPAEDADTFFKIGDIAYTVKEGFDVFAEKVSAPIRKKYVGWKAVEIKRMGNNGLQQVVFEVGKKSLVTRTCAKTILAFPPLLKNLAVLITDLDDKEKDIFNQVKIHKYASSGVWVPNQNRWVYSGLVPHIGLDYNRNTIPNMTYPSGDGGVVVLTKANKGTGTNYFNAYSWIHGDYTDKADTDDMQVMKLKLNSIIKKMHPFSKMLGIWTTEYFPHVTGKSIMDGFYKDLNSIQGKGGLYYATTLLTFECVNNAIEMGEKFADKYF